MLNSMDIKTATLNGVATIEIARPHKKNALTAEMYSAMAAALRAADADAAVRALLVTGQPGIFTSGNDIDDFMNRPPSTPDAPVFDFMRALVACRKPVVAAVTGAAIGIGTTMFIFHEMVLPLTVPPAMSIEPRLPISEPLKVSPSGTTVRVPL
jgi:enoyl-CoA hydratase/carnithine racemase